MVSRIIRVWGARACGYIKPAPGAGNAGMGMRFGYFVGPASIPGGPDGPGIKHGPEGPGRPGAHAIFAAPTAGEVGPLPLCIQPRQGRSAACI